MNKLATIVPWDKLPSLIRDWFHGKEEQYRLAWRNCPLPIEKEDYYQSVHCYWIKTSAEQSSESIAVPVDYVTLHNPPAEESIPKEVEEPFILPLVVPRKIKKRIR